jgi:hypothetical protein
VFDGRCISWNELASLFDGNRYLLRADEIYQASCSVDNSDGSMTGAELLKAFQDGNDFFVGCGGGLDGKSLQTDLSTRRWHTRRYQVNRTKESPTNRNWFRLSEFMAKIGQRTNKL